MLIYGLFFIVIKKLLPYIKEMIGETLFWIILIELVVLGIIGYLLKREIKNK